MFVPNAIPLPYYPSQNQVMECTTRQCINEIHNDHHSFQILERVDWSIHMVLGFLSTAPVHYIQKSDRPLFRQSILSARPYSPGFVTKDSLRDKRTSQVWGHCQHDRRCPSMKPHQTLILTRRNSLHRFLASNFELTSPTMRYMPIHFPMATVFTVASIVGGTVVGLALAIGHLLFLSPTFATDTLCIFALLCLFSSSPCVRVPLVFISYPLGWVFRAHCVITPATEEGNRIQGWVGGSALELWCL